MSTSISCNTRHVRDMRQAGMRSERRGRRETWKRESACATLETRLAHGMLLRDQSAMLLRTMLLASMLQRDDSSFRHLTHLTPIILSHGIYMPPQLYEIAITRTRKHFGILINYVQNQERMFKIASRFKCLRRVASWWLQAAKVNF